MLRIGVAADGLALLKSSRWRSAPPELLAELALERGVGPQALGAGLRQLLADAGCAGWTASVVVSDELARLWHVTPPQGSARMADLEGAAALRFQALYGESAAGWHVAADWHPARPFLAAALPRQLSASLAQAAAQERVTLVEVVPQFVAGWNRWQRSIKPGAWFGQLQADVLTLGALDAGVLRALRSAAVPQGATANLDWLAQHVAREALRLNLAAPARLQLAGLAPAAWNNSSGAFACSLLSAQDGKLSPGARLALTGVAA